MTKHPCIHPWGREQAEPRWRYWAPQLPASAACCNMAALFPSSFSLLLRMFQQLKTVQRTRAQYLNAMQAYLRVVLVCHCYNSKMRHTINKILWLLTVTVNTHNTQSNQNKVHATLSGLYRNIPTVYFGTGFRGFFARMYTFEVSYCTYYTRTLYKIFIKF